MGEKNYFEILNVSYDAEVEVISSAYKALAKKYHPDTTSLPQKEAHIKMALINEAYEVLSDEKRKREYVDKLFSEQNKSESGMSNMSKQEYAKNDVNESTELSAAEKVIGCTFWVIVLICIICCIIRFGFPEIERSVYEFQKELEKIISTFRH